VTNRARLFFEGKNAHSSYETTLHASVDLLKESRYEEDVDLITERFDKKTKPSFRNVGDNYWIQFSGAREKDAALNIKAGQLRVQGCVWSPYLLVGPSKFDLVLISSLSSTPRSKTSYELLINKLSLRLRRFR